MPDLEQLIGDTCVYQCTHGEWVLVGGSVSPGYHCPEIDGDCTTPGTIIRTPPVPITPPDPPEAMAPRASYRYDEPTKMLCFSSGIQTEGFGYANTLSMEECKKLYPEHAAKLQELQAKQDLSGLKFELPALPIQQMAEWYKSKSAKGSA
ncbi:MAG: hypothetical protein MUC43_13440 [Pirellula sp.]|nr:hypothetical protein [Pirellula sp.]